MNGWYIYTMEEYSALKKKALTQFTGKWIEWGKSHNQKDKSYIFSLSGI
jgi:glutamate dehydrogenase/leucine dehydrogenase